MAQSALQKVGYPFLIRGCQYQGQSICRLCQVSGAPVLFLAIPKFQLFLVGLRESIVCEFPIQKLQMADTGPNLLGTIANPIKNEPGILFRIKCHRTEDNSISTSMPWWLVVKITALASRILGPQQPCLG